MGCPDAFKPDFFNNVAAVAMVLIFAKVVAHRANKEPSPCRACWHGLAVATAAAAVVASLWATEKCSDYGPFHWVAWGGLILAGLIIAGEIIHDDVCPALKQGK